MTEGRIGVVAGTTEGRQLAECLEKYKKNAVILVATEYGQKVLPDFHYCTIQQGRMNEQELTFFLKEQGITLLLDATHPYAREITANCKNACKAAQIQYYRVLRDSVAISDYLEPSEYVTVLGMEEAVEYLANCSGNVLVTTGSKEAEALTKLKDFQKRIYIRVLPGAEIRQTLLSLGYDERQILSGQGPFSKEENLQVLQEKKIAYLLTKDSGRIGGFVEKLTAAKESGVQVVLVNRPKEQGISLKQAKELICQKQ